MESGAVENTAGEAAARRHGVVIWTVRSSFGAAVTAASAGAEVDLEEAEEGSAGLEAVASAAAVPAAAGDLKVE